MQRFHEILVLVSSDPEMPRVIARAAELAERNRARLTLIDVVPGLGTRRLGRGSASSDIDLQALLVEARRNELEELAARVMTVETRVVVEVGVRFAKVIERVIEYEHDLVITAPDRSESHRGLGGSSTTLHLLRKCPVPVWVDDPRTWGRQDVVVAIGPFPEDGEIGSLNRMLVELGVSLARIQGGQVHIAHAWRLEGEHLLRNSKVRLPAARVDALVDEERVANEKTFDQILDGIDITGMDPQLHLVEGRAADVINRVVDDVQPGVVVMGTLARAGLRGLIIGNTAERILGDLEASVIAVKPPGFVSPVGG
ncbi:MAG: universal stress protein [Acidimicrobiia bacterium]|nr:universal stress protein [Acidimicrobiia bacterium]